ncbi:hypothetical protein DL98DRAFT_435865, partial [Cadophora sp. DSE1049]
CLVRILANHKDFYHQKSAIEELLLARGHKCLFLPKFHCKLNLIKIFETTKKEVIKALDACFINTLRRFYNRALRFMDAYRKGLSVKQAAWAVKKQKGHRVISEEIMKEFDSILRVDQVDELT